MTASAHRRGLRALPASEPALEVLYLRYHEFVRRALRQHYVNPSELEDMTQQVFLVLLRRVDEATRKLSIAAWLYQIARRVAANHHRGLRRLVRKHRELAVHDPRAAALSDASDPEQRYAREQAWSFIRDFLESLDEEACAVFVMSEIEGLRGADIAARLRLTLPMTYARIRTVRARFDREIARSRQRALAVAVLPSATSLTLQALATSWRLQVGLGAVLLALIWLLGGLDRHGHDSEGPGPSEIASQRSEDDDRETLRGPDLDAHAIRRGPQATGVFAGIVVDRDGSPIPGAIVCADRGEDAEHRLSDPPACVTSDSAGRFRIRGALAQAHALEAMARGFVPGRFRGRPTEGVRILLHPGGVELSGVVSDVHGGPVEGAWVSVENRVAATLGSTVRTDDAGAFSLWVVEGPVSLAAGADGYAATFNLALAPAHDVRIELGAESILAGIVVDGETGDPVAGVRVGALLGPQSERYANRGRVGFSDAQGRWEIRGLQPNQYHLDAAGDRSWGRGPHPIDLGIGQHQDGIRIEMIAGADIVGRIFDSDTGEGCVDGYAVTDDLAQSLDRGGLVHGDGLVAVRALTGAAVYEVTVSCRGYANRTFDVDLREGPVPPQEWPVTRGSELVVRVVDDAGTPLADWSVDVDRHHSHLELKQETTDADGSAVFVGVTPGTHKVVASGPGHPRVVAEAVEVGAGRSEVELQAAPGVPVNGKVVSDDGRPVAGALVALQRPTPEGGSVELVSQAGPYHAVTDADGAFRHASVATGEYGVWVQPADAAVAVQRPGTLPWDIAVRVAGEPLRTVTVRDREVALTLELGGLRSISGVVRDDDGDLVMDARVFAVRQHDDDVLDPRGRPRLTDASGRYAFDDLPAGTYSLTAYRHGGGVARRAGVEAGARAVDLVFQAPGRISGRVRMADGSAVTGFGLHVEGKSQAEVPFIPGGSKDGRFVATGLEPGDYTLRVMAPQGYGDAKVELSAGEHRSGIEITLEAFASVRGRLVDGDGSPRIGWIAIVRDAGASAERPPGFVQATTTDTDGTFEIREVLPWTIGVAALPALPPVLDAAAGRELFTGAPELRVVTLKSGETLDLGDVVVGPAE